MDFIIDDEAREIANALKLEDSSLALVEFDRVLFAKEISGKMQFKRVADVKPVTPPYNLLNPNVLYIVSTYSKYWDSLSSEEKASAMLHQLYHITNFDGTIAHHNVVDFKEVIEQYGFRDPDG